MHSFLNEYLRFLAREAALQPCTYDLDSVDTYVKAQTAYMMARIGGFKDGSFIAVDPSKPMAC